MSGPREASGTRSVAGVFILATVLGIWAIACGERSDRARVLLVTTTSVEASGLLDAMAASYDRAQTSYRLSATATGSGAALEMGRRGDADVLLTHDPEGERRFMEEGHGRERGPVMRNRFIIAGPANDPAGVAGVGTGREALRRIAAARAPFLSRGDDSGTHTRELSLWREAGLSPATGGDWYMEAGTGMGETLQMANQLEAYLLTDDASYLFLQDRLERLRPYITADPSLDNPYSYILPVDARNPEGGRDFVEWLTGPGQALIAEYGRGAVGEPLFVPAVPPSGN